MPANNPAAPPYLSYQLPLCSRIYRQQELTGLKLTLDPYSKQSLHKLQPPNNQLCILIGPEGGLTDEEIQQTKLLGFEGIQLGPRILRTETAALTALALSQTLWGDFNR